MPNDDSTVEDDELLYRRIPGVLAVVDEASGDWRPSSGAFKSDDDGLSVYLNSILESEELGPRTLTELQLGSGVAQVRADVVRGMKLGIVRDPWPPGSDDHKRNAAHGLIRGMNDLSSRQRRRVQKELALAFAWVIKPAVASEQ